MGKEALCCSVCENTWNSTDHQPVALPACGHTFCRHCLIKIHKMEGNVKCPICRKGLEKATPEDLPTNFALLNLVDPDVQDVPRKKEDPQDVPQKKKEGSVDSGLPEKPDTKPKPEDKTSEDEEESGISTSTKMLIGAAVGGAGCVVAAPLVLTAVGFTSAGIAAGSWAASMMSSAAIANGGGVAAGSMVAALQSFGAAGITAAANAGIAAGGAAVGAGGTLGFSFLARKGEKDKPEENKTDDEPQEKKKPDDKPEGKTN